MDMITDLYQEYLYVIGKLKDIYGLHLEVDHKDIHTFFKDKKPMFKLMYGTFTADNEPSIVISFHIDLSHADVIMWFTNVYRIHPLLILRDSYIEDSKGETYLGEDAEVLKHIYMAQDILKEWLDNHSIEEMEEYVKAEVHGQVYEPTKTFDSRDQREEAIISFSRNRKPSDDDTLH
jgi:hypothetical protein